MFETTVAVRSARGSRIDQNDTPASLPDEEHFVVRRAEPEPEAVAPLLRLLAAGPDQLAHPLARDDPRRRRSADQSALHVRNGRVDPAVAAPADREVEDVRARLVDDIRGRFVRAARPTAGTRCRPSRPARRPACARARRTARRSRARRAAQARRSRCCSTRTARPARTSSGTRRARQVVLRRREPVDRNRELERVDVGVDLLVEVVADPRAVREQVLDRDVVADERQVAAEQRPRRRRERRACRPRSGSRLPARSALSSRSRARNGCRARSGSPSADRRDRRPSRRGVRRRGRSASRRRSPPPPPERQSHVRGRPWNPAAGDDRTKRFRASRGVWRSRSRTRRSRPARGRAGRASRGRA